MDEGAPPTGTQPMFRSSRRSILPSALFGSSSINLQNNSSLLIESGGYDGLGIGSASSFYTDNTCSLTVRNATRFGLNIWGTSHAHLKGTVLVENNVGTGGAGVVVTQMSSFYFQDGTATIQNNINNGVYADTSEVRVDAAGTLTVSGTTGSGNGIYLFNNSALRISGGGLLVQNNIGTSGHGIHVANGAQVSLSPSGTKTVDVHNNPYGVYVWDGSINGSGAVTITGNGTKDVNLSFGSRASLPTSSYSTIACTGSSMTTMGVSCSP